MAVKSPAVCEMDMTPMIDCVFQLIIFFIVTINLERDYKEDIFLEDAPHAELAGKESEKTMVVEVDKRGLISLNTVPVSPYQFQAIIQRRYNMMGEFPVLIRADYRTMHRNVRTVMDICSATGLYKLQFAGIKEHKGSKRRPSG